ncbi:MAG: hypothetical protein JWN56_2407 [Sphingobacteriales bacterium]|nr:hypothetical protein [Sphingobacteriales bacterium]
MKTFIKSGLICAVICGLSVSASAQGLLKKIKQSAESAAEKRISKEINKKLGNEPSADNPSQQNASDVPGSKNNPNNKGGAGLITTPPDVKANITIAETAFKANQYGETRYAIQQAMLGVEMEIGKKILTNMPGSIVGLAAKKDEDKVTSTGWGWAGLTIYREYLEGDKQLRATIANNSVWMNAVNMFLVNGAYGQTTNNQQKWKQTKVKGYKAVIEYDESSGYKLSVPIGQTSLLMLEGVNFANENDLMAAANSFDIDGIKKTLGEK